MKKMIVFVVFIHFVFGINAQSLQPDTYYKQKRWKDSLLTNRKLPAFIVMPDSKTALNMPVLRLQNEGEKVNANRQGNIYKMEADNMLCLKLYESGVAMPNAEERKEFTLPPMIKKP